MNFFNRKRRAYMEVLLVVFTLMLFLTAHYLLSIHYYSRQDLVWMGINLSGFIADFTLYSAIFLTFILFILVLHRNFIVRGKRKR